MGFRDDAETALIVSANLPKSGNLHDQVVILIPRLDPGSSTVSVSCDPEVDTCADLLFEIGLSGNEQTFDRFCFLESGTLTISTISTISATRATGSFSGNGQCLTQSNSLSSFSVSGGTFDVPITNISVF